MSNFSIAYQFKAMYGNFQRGVKAVKRDMKGLMTQIEAQNLATKKLRSNLRGAGMGMTKYLTVPLVAAGAASVLVGAKFEDSMASLSALTGITGKNLTKMQEQIMATGEKYGIAASDLAKGVELIGSKQPALLKTPALLLKVTAAATTLSKAAGQELPEAADNLLSIMNAFAITGKDVNKVINVLAASSKYGAAQIPYLSDAIKNAAAGSKFAKLQFAQVAAAIEVASEKTGLMSSMVGRGFGNAMLRLEVQTNTKFKPSIVGLTKALDNIADAHLSAKKATKLWGIENIKVANELIINRKQIETLTKNITGTNVAFEQAAIRMKTFNEEMAVMWVRIKDVMIRAFFLLEPYLKTYVANLSHMAKATGNFIKAHPALTKFILKMAALLAIVGPGLIVFSKLITAFTTLRAVLFGTNAASILFNRNLLGTIKELGYMRTSALLIGAALVGWKIGGLIGQLKWVKANITGPIAETLFGGVVAGKQEQLAKTTRMVNTKLNLIKELKSVAATQGFKGSIAPIAAGAKSTEQAQLLIGQLAAGKVNLSSFAGKTPEQIQHRIVIETKDPQNVIKNVHSVVEKKHVNVGIAMGGGMYSGY